MTAARAKAGAGAAKGAAKSRATAPRAAEAGALAVLDRAAQGEFPASLYVDGPEEALKAFFLSEFRRAWAAAVPEAPMARVMRPGENDVDAILAAYHGISMFTPRELTLVLGAESLAKSEKKASALAEGVARPAGTSCIVIVESAAEKERKTLAPLRDACALHWAAERIGPRELLAWGARKLATAKLEIEPGALEALLETCEGESVAFFNEIGKLDSWCGREGRVTKAAVAALTAPVVGADLGGYLEAVAAGDPALAAKRLGRMLTAGESEGSVMFALANLVAGALGGWARHKAASATLGRRRSPDALAAALDAVYRAEAAWKGGRTDALSALEHATREVAAA